MNAAYDRSHLRPRILHLGLEAFFRAHLADYTDCANRNSDNLWGIRAVKTRPGGDELTNVINSNGGNYSLIETSSAGSTAKVIGALYDTVFYESAPYKVFELFTQPDFAIVTATITEKGYCYDFGNKKLDENNPDIAHDIMHPSQPRSAIGIIVHGLSLRKQSGLGGITLLSCDNMTNNGNTFCAAIVGYARLVDSELAVWIKKHCTFPCAMVDRIVPAMTSDSLKYATDISGYEDKAAIVCERFKQWVVEDKFANGRPRWEDSGAIFTHDVEPFEEMKLRLLNGSHSTLAYCGYLNGYETVDGAINDTRLQNLVQSYWRDEAIPTLVEPIGIKFSDYTAALIERYRNPALKHRLWQIAMDGSQKLPYRLLNGLRENIAAGRSYRCTATAIAAWLCYVSGWNLNCQSIDVRDPLAELFASCYIENPTESGYVRCMLQNERVFGNLAGNEVLTSAVLSEYQRIRAEKRV